MSYGNSHIISQKTIYFGNPQDPSKTGDRLRVYKNVNGWRLTMEVDEYGKISMYTSKPIGTLSSLAQGTDREADITISLNTTQKRAPPLKIVGYDRYEPKFVELDDKLSRTTESFKEQDEYYKRAYPGSSVLKTDELFTEMIPTLEQVIGDKKLNEYISKIADETSKVQKPWNRNWKPAK